jgi:hypothetical protein
MYSLSSQPFSKMCHSMPQITGDVRARAEADKLCGVRGGSCEARVADDERRIVLLLGLEQVLQRHRMRLGRIAADEEHRLRLHDVVVGVRHGAVAPRVRDARDGRGVADARLVVAVVGAPEGVELAEQVGLLVGELGGAQEVDGVLARRLADVEHLVADLVDGDIPADAGPFARDELHRILEPAVAVRMLARGRALGAMRTEVERAIEARLLADPDAVLHLGHDGAADRAVRAHRFLDVDLAAGRGCRGFRLPHPAARDRRNGGEAADGEPRVPQERAPVHCAGRLILEGRRQPGTLCDAAHLFLEHASLP